MTPRVLLYGVGGYTQANLDSAIWITGGPTLHHDDHVDGWFIGGGTEVKLHHRASLKFVFADYDGGNATGSTSKTTDKDCHPKKCQEIDIVKTSSDMDLEVQSVRALLVFRLEREERVVQPLKQDDKPTAGAGANSFGIAGTVAFGCRAWRETPRATPVVLRTGLSC